MDLLMLRRRMMMTAIKNEEPNGLKPSASVGTGSSVAYVSDDGLLHISKWSGGPRNRIDCEFKRPFELNAGDTFNIKIVKKSGSISAAQFADVLLDYSIGAVNKLWAKTATPWDQTTTASAARTVTFIGINNRTGSGTFTDYSVEIQITVNGERII